MGDLQVDLNAALVAVKQKCVDLDEKVRREDEKPQNRGRGYLGVKRYIYALTTKNSEHSLNRRGRSLTRVYVEQKFYRSKSVPSADQVQRLEDCTQDYGPNGEERLEFTETIQGPLEELIKEDQSHHQMVQQRLPKGHGEWDHELAVYEEDGLTGRLEDRTLTLRAGDHPFGMNQFNESEEISSKIAKFFGSSTEVDQIRTRELSLSVHPVYHQSSGEPYTSFGMLPRSKSVGNVANQSKIQQTTNSLSDLYVVQTRHDYDSKYGHYQSGYGRYGQLPPPANPEVMPKVPKLPKTTEVIKTDLITDKTHEHIYDQPIVPPPRRSSLHYTPYESTYTYDRKYDFKSTFPPDVQLPEGYHNYYDPSKFMFLDSQGYYQGNITRPLHYTYSRDYLEKYSDYQGTSQRETPIPPVEPEPEPYLVLQKTEDLPHSITHLKFAFPDYYDQKTRMILERSEDLKKVPLEIGGIVPEYYDNSSRVVLPYTQDLDHQLIEIQTHPEYYDLATRYPVLRRTSDIAHEIILIQEWPEYRPYEVQELIETFDDEPVYEEVYEPVLPVLPYHHDPDHFVFIPSAPLTPPPPPPEPIYEEIYEAIPAEVIPVPIPVPAERHLEEIYVGQDALDVSVTPTFGQTDDHKKNLGLEKSVHDRVREMEDQMRGDEGARRAEQERREKLERIQEEIRVAREAEMRQMELEQAQSYNAYEERESAPSSPCKIKCDKRKKPNRKDTPAPIPQPILVPDVFVIPKPEPIPEKPKRQWQPPPKPEEELTEHDEKPLGPVIFHELIYQQGILRQKFHEEHHNSSVRPVSRPVSRANSRPNTPGLEPKSIDFPRLEGGPRTPLGEDNVDYVQERIQRYDAYGASLSPQDSHGHSEKHSSSSNTVQVHEHVEHHHHVEHDGEHHHHHHHHHHYHHGDKEQEIRRESVVYDEPSREIVYDVPHEDHHHHHHSSEAHYDTVSHDDRQYHQAIRHMSKSNKWSEKELPVVVPAPKRAKIEAHVPANSPFVKTSSDASHTTTVTSTTHSTVLHHSNSLNRQNIPPPLLIQDGNSRHSHSHHDIHVHYAEDSDSENHREIHSSKSVTELYSPVSVGHVKNLAKKFNKPDEKPITTEQVIYRTRVAPPGHHLQQEIKPRPRSLPRVPMDEVELHEHGAQDHMTRSHHEHTDFNGNQGHLIGSGAEVKVQVHGNQRSTEKSSTHHNSHFHYQSDEPTIRVRRVYKALEDTSMLSPISLGDENMYDVPAN